jgi:DNA-binding IclR family transcriptional regulator
MSSATHRVAGEAPRSVLGRALGVLAAFSDAAPELALGDIVAATSLPPATAHRIVAELVAWGALERIGRGRYRVGMRLWRVGALAPTARTLREATLPPMQDLAAATGYVVHLVVPDGSRAVVVERLAGSADGTEGPDGVGALPRPRSGLPRPASAAGTVLLAHAATTLGVLPEPGTDAGALPGALAEVRRTGYCLSRDGTVGGTGSVAAPVSDVRGRVVAALAVVVPASVALPPFVPAVRMAAAAASRRLGALRAGEP